MDRVIRQFLPPCVIAISIMASLLGDANAQQSNASQRKANVSQKPTRFAQQRRPVSLQRKAQPPRWSPTRRRPRPAPVRMTRGNNSQHQRMASRQEAAGDEGLQPFSEEDSTGLDEESVEDTAPAELPTTAESPEQHFPPPPGYDLVESGYHYEETDEGGCGDSGCDDSCDGEINDCCTGSCENYGCGCGRCAPCWTPGSCMGCLYGALSECKHKFTVSSGVQGFKGPVNRGGDGSFGFHEGINFALPLSPCQQLGWQIGFEGVHSNFHRTDFVDNSFGDSTNDGRDQLFLTTGFYRRTQCGLQFGAAWDYLYESWDLNFDVGQIRGQLSWITPWCHEVGFLVSTDTTNDSVADLEGTSRTIETTDYYSFFYKYSASCGGFGRIFAGWTQDSNGLIGVDMELPVMHHWGVLSEFSYLVPDDGSTSQGSQREAWNVGVSIVWYPGGNARATNCCTTRPMFRVANNGSLFTNFR